MATTEGLILATTATRSAWLWRASCCAQDVLSDSANRPATGTNRRDMRMRLFSKQWLVKSLTNPRVGEGSVVVQIEEIPRADDDPQHRHVLDAEGDIRVRLGRDHFREAFLAVAVNGDQRLAVRPGAAIDAEVGFEI